MDQEISFLSIKTNQSNVQEYGVYIINTSDQVEEIFGINNIKMNIQIEELTTSKNQVEYLQKIWKT